MDPATLNAPTLDNQFASDRMLRNALAHWLPDEPFEAIHDRFHTEGARQQQRYTLQPRPPSHRGHIWMEDAWGTPVNGTSVPSSWSQARRTIVKHEVLRIPQAQAHGSHSRLVQMALMHLLAPEAPGLAPLVATTDVAVHTLMRTGTADHLERLIPRFTSTNPDEAYLCDIWGSSHLLSAPSHSLQATQTDGTWHINGRTLTHAATYPDAALLLARDEHGTHHLFLLEQPKTADGVHIDAPVQSAMYAAAPTATLRFNDVKVEHLTDDIGRRGPVPFLQYLWDAVLTVSHMRRTLALARSAAETWHVQEREMAYNPLVQETLADMQARYESAFNLTYRSVRALSTANAPTRAEEKSLAVLLAPLAKHHAIDQAGHIASRALQVWGHTVMRADTGLARALDPTRAQAVANGTAHDLALQLLHTLEHNQQFGLLRRDLKDTLQGVSVETLVRPMKEAVLAFRDANDWLHHAREEGGEILEAGAHRFTKTVSNALSVALMINHAEWALTRDQDGRPAAAVKRFASTPLSYISDLDPHDAYVLTWDFNCPTLFECHSGTSSDVSLPAVQSMMAS